MASDSNRPVAWLRQARDRAVPALGRLWQVLRRQGAKVRLHHAGLAVGLVVLVGVSAGAYAEAETAVLMTVDGQTRRVRTYRRTVGGLLSSQGVDWSDGDIVMPPPDGWVTEAMEITVLHARRAVVEADGRLYRVVTHARTPAGILRECGLTFAETDQVRVNGRPWGLDAPLAGQPLSLRLALRRSVPVEVQIDGARATLFTAAPTVGEALRQEGILLHLGDLVRPSLGTPVSAGLRVFIERSVPVQVEVDRRVLDTRTRRETVADVLADEGVHLVGRDYVAPPLQTAVTPGMAIRVVRVREALELEQESIPYETIWRPDPQLELDQQQVRRAGEPGLIKRRYRVLLEDGQVRDRSLEETWIDREPTTRLIAYGTDIVPRDLETPAGTFTYWRKVRLLATSYTAATSGKARDHPEYGVTYLGWSMRKGIVAVDPRVIPLGSKVYVPGYGVGVAADTGGAIKGRRIDLGYGEEDLVLWYRWVDVYLLTPTPPKDEIRWVLPNWPVER